MKKKNFKKTIYLLTSLAIFLNVTLSTGCFAVRANKYFDKIMAYAQKYDIEKQLLFSLIDVESSFDKDAISKRGAQGLMQLTVKTAFYIADICDYVGEINLFDVDCNLTLGCEYINYLQDKFPSESALLCAYNAGEGTVAKWLKNSQYSSDGKTLMVIPYSETRDYVKKIEKRKIVFKRYLEFKGKV